MAVTLAPRDGVRAERLRVRAVADAVHVVVLPGIPDIDADGDRARVDVGGMVRDAVRDIVAACVRDANVAVWESDPPDRVHDAEAVAAVSVADPTEREADGVRVVEWV